ncbi:hypothetical protein ASF10_23325 [Flavobacterium sp. Leaf82]|uniref:hypothetical protein n=1 Tax=unclassified Flavobacterium TaxID=196869 RepID=UPI0006FB67E4|nr:hypothetical protein [Flavobacterium sp. Leaf82]KQO27276.1 hypothetical protein ASF10_23325 [Flavobacterium sp. Leaf82]
MRKLLVILLIFISLKSYSCSCAGVPAITKNWEGANEIFTGEIIKVDTLLYGNNGAKIYSYTCRILKSYKSEIYPGRELRTILSQSSASCDFMFQLGKTYLIYAKSESQTLACSICSRSNILENVEKEELQTLEKLYQKYKSDTSGVRMIKFENNISYQIGLIENIYQEKLKKKEKTIYILSSLIAVLIVLVVIMLLKRKNSR